LKQILEQSSGLNLVTPKFCYWSDLPRITEQVQSIPAANLVSFTVIASGRNGFSDALQDLLVSARRFETLAFMFILPFSPERGTLPPIKRLSLPSMVWDYSPEDVERIWDFSLLQELDIPWHVLRQFLQSVSPKTLGHLKQIRVDDTCWESPYIGTHFDRFTKGKTFTKRFETLFQDRYDFQVLDIRCLLDIFDTSLIAQQGQSLGMLKFLDLSGFEADGFFSTISLSDFDLIQESCTRITKLDIGVNIIGGEVSCSQNESVSLLRILNSRATDYGLSRYHIWLPKS
jgi:hypothetical protein